MSGRTSDTPEDLAVMMAWRGSIAQMQGEGESLNDASRAMGHNRNWLANQRCFRNAPLTTTVAQVARHFGWRLQLVGPGRVVDLTGDGSPQPSAVGSAGALEAARSSLARAGVACGTCRHYDAADGRKGFCLLHRGSTAEDGGWCWRWES